MKTVRHARYGAPDVLRVEEADKPTPGDNELLVRVRAATVNRTDCALLTAKPFIMRFMTGLWRPKQRTTGTDFAGEIEAVGQAVTDFQVGDQVFGIDDLGVGSHAEYLTISADKAVAHMPAGMPFQDVAACIEGGWYGYSFVQRVGGVGPEHRVLINGATGAIGSATLQLCVHHGSVVTAVGDGQNLELLRSLGADRVIDYQQQDFTQDQQSYDFIFDAVGKSTFGACKHLLKESGVYSSSELGPGGQNIFLSLLAPLAKKKVVFPLPIDKKEWLRELQGLLESRSFSAVIDRRYKIDEIREAFSYVASGQKTGAVVLTFEQKPRPS